MSLEQAFQKIKEKCREIKYKYPSASPIYIQLEDRAQLAKLWEEYVALLPPQYENQVIAIIGYPKVVPLKDIPQQIMADPHFASLIVKTYGG